MPIRSRVGRQTRTLPKYRNVPFNTGRDPDRQAEISAAYQAAGSREELNRLDVDLNQRGVAAIATAVARAPVGGVLLHCHAGKDRPGRLALLLSLVGVPDEAIADDYALTAANLAPLTAEWLDSMSSEPAERARLRSSPGLRARHADTLPTCDAGGAEAYSRAASHLWTSSASATGSWSA